MKHFITKIVSNSSLLRSTTRKLSQLYHNAFLLDIEQQVRKITQNRVVAGPFKGMHYPTLPPSTVHTSVIPKLLGIYEKELYPAIDDLLSRRAYDRFIDIGAAEGYYVAGMALRVPEISAIAFEADPGLRSSLTTLCDVNKVTDRVQMRGWCSPNDLVSLGSSKRTLVLCDCEGGEIDLITKVTTSALGSCDFIIECHDMYVQDCCETLTSLLCETHQVTVTVSHERTLTDVTSDLLAKLVGRPDEIEYAIGEHRHYEMSWIIAEKR